MRFRRHLILPDTQCKPGTPVEHIIAAGNFAAEKRPEVIVLLGDWFDMPSLSAWDSDAKKAEQKVNYADDIAFGRKALDLFIAPIKKVRSYRPEMHFCCGNHENRITRYTDDFPILRGTLGLQSLWLKERGFRVHPFLEIAQIDGIAYSHYFCMDSNGRVMNSKRGQASAKAQVQNVGMSATAGHKQGLDIHIKESPAGRRIGLICGSFYQHQEEYLSPQGNAHWSGIVMKHEVSEGSYDPMFVSMDFLLRRYV